MAKEVAAKGMEEEQSVAVSGSTLWPIEVVRTMRPHQWAKNVFVLAPLFFSQAFLEWEQVLRGAAATILFCLVAGTVYLINDIADRDRDRRHPTKRHRPIAAGRLPVRYAVVAAWLCGVGSLLAALAWRPTLAAVLAIYLVMNLAYSKVLKEWAFVDVGVIATGFVLRIVAGGLAVGVFLSEWLVLCTFLLACFLALGKRRHELALCRAGAANGTRQGWETYETEQLDVGLFFVAGLTVAAYTIYVLTASLPELTASLLEQPLRTRATPFSSALLPLTIPLVVMGLARFYQLARRQTPHSPTEAMLRDRVVWAIVAVWGTSLMAMALW